MDGQRFAEFAEYFKEIIKNYSDKNGQEFLANALNSSQGTISRILNGVALPNEDMIKRMNILWDVDMSDKVREARENFEKSKKEGNKVVKSFDATKPRLPISASAGKLSVYLDGYMRSECEEMPIVRSFPDYDFTMFIKGNSMEPKYESGDEIALKAATIIEWGKDYVLATEDGAIFKKIYDEGDSIRCVSYNHEEYPDFLVPKNAIYGYYRFVGLIRI